MKIIKCIVSILSFLGWLIGNIGIFLVKVESWILEFCQHLLKQ